MAFLRKNIIVFGLLFLILLIYFVLRLPNLTMQPVFVDEAIYIRWAQVMRAEPTLRFLPLSDGKTPLFMWMMMPLFKFIADPVVAGRSLSVAFGMVTLLGIFFMGWRFFNHRVGLWAAFFMAITPFMVFFDRLALVDSTLAACTVWSINIALLVLQYRRIDLAMVLGYILGVGLLVKTPAMFNIIALPTTLIGFQFHSKKRVGLLGDLLKCWFIAIGIAMVIYNFLRLGPGFSNLSSRNQDYIHSPLILLKHPLDPFIPHLRDILDWYPNFFTPPILLLVLCGIVFTILKKNKIGLTLLAWTLIPLFLQTALLQTFTARYILGATPIFLCLAAFGLDSLLQKFAVKKGAFLLGIGIIVGMWPLWYSWTISHAIEQAPLPREERRGYLEEWTAGYGLSEIADYLTEASKKEGIVVGTEGYFGTLPDGLWIYLDKTPNITIIGGGPSISPQLYEAAKTHPTYFVANKSRVPKLPVGVELIKEYPKALPRTGVQDAMLLMKVLAPK